MNKSDRQTIELHLKRRDTETAGRLAADMAPAYDNDPQFWLTSAGLSAHVDDYQQVCLALARVDQILTRMSKACSGHGAFDGAFDQLKWDREKIWSNMLQVLTEGDALFLPALLESLERLAALDPGDIRKDVGASHAFMHALMCAGRFDEAERYLTRPEYTLKVALCPFALDYPRVVRWLCDRRRDPLQGVTPFPAAEGDRFVLAMTVWGPSFMNSMARFTLPSLLSEGNLPYLARAGDVRFVFLTSEADAAWLERMPAFQATRSIVTCDILTFPTELARFPETYKLMSTMHLSAMAIARATHSHFYFVAPDIIVADNFLKALDQRRRGGKDVIFVGGVMLELESFTVEQARRFPSAHEVISISPGELLELGLGHLHRLTQDYYLGTSERRGSASVSIWHLSSGGILAHGFHHSPFLVSASAMQRFDGSMFLSIDAQFLTKLIHFPDDLEGCVLIGDALETCYFELSTRRRPAGLTASGWDIPRIARWGVVQGRTAKWLFRQPVRFEPHATDAGDPAYQSSREHVEAVLRQMDDLERQGFPFSAGS